MQFVHLAVMEFTKLVMEFVTLSVMELVHQLVMSIWKVVFFRKLVGEEHSQILGDHNEIKT